MQLGTMFFARNARALGAPATLLLLSILSTMGCQAILGIEKAKQDPSLTSGDGDETTTPGDGDNGDGDTTVDGDGDGDSTTTGDGDGDAPIPVDGVPGAYFSLGSCSSDVKVAADDLISCLYRVSCDPGVPSMSVSTCITFDYLHASAGESCSRGVTSCAEVYACIHRSPATSDQLAICDEDVGCDGVCTGTCDGECDYTYEYNGTTMCNGYCDGACLGTCDGYYDVSKKWACDGDSAINCTSSSPTIDCGALGASCHESLTSSPSADGGCSPNSPGATAQEICAAGDNETPHCDDNQYYWCADGVVWGIDCEYGCIEGADGAYCAASTDTCDSPGTSKCSGDDLHFCNDDGSFFVHACDQNDLNCSEDGTDCVADGCSSSYCAEECLDDHTLSVCVGGAQIEIDCTEYGFTGCVEEYYSGVDFARCSLGGEQ